MEGNASTQAENELLKTSLTKHVIDIQEYDVLLGRGKLYEKHVGNLNLRDLIVANMERYFQAKKPDEKFNISVEIVNSIHDSYHGRFLKRGNRCWVLVDLSEARDKVAQAIQYQRRKQLSAGKGLQKSTRR